MMLYAKRVKRAGFTLIEIMIVIAIIAILAGIVVPNFVQARQESQLAACRENCKNIGLAVAAYLVRHSDYELYCSLEGRSGYSRDEFYKDDDISQYWPCSCLDKVVDVRTTADGGNLKCPCGGTYNDYSIWYNRYINTNLMGGTNADKAIKYAYKGWIIICGSSSNTASTVYTHKLKQAYIRPAYLVGIGAVDCYKARE